jgi:hypothetical protein
VLAVTIDQLRLTLIPQLMCHRVRMDRKTANTSDIVSIIDVIKPCWQTGKVKKNLLLEHKNKKNLQL